MQETFYATFAGLAFALLGLWWVVVEFRHQEWVADRARRRTAYFVSLSFALPGIMSLVSLIATDSTFLWRVSFFSAGAFGLLYGISMVPSVGPSRSGWFSASRWLAVALYAVVCLVALFPATVTELLPLSAIETEAVTLSLLLFLGINTAWFFFTAPAPFADRAAVADQEGGPAR
ncbi:MAG: hypothetical protein R2737_10155 [Candidatus Nanopelagicales bacterium]